MYFTAAEKHNSGFFSSWTPVIVAFDVTRRYLYCSAALSSPSSNTRPEQLQWKSKLKLRQAVGACSHLTLNIQEDWVKERQFYEVEILGEKRPMVKNEIPPPEPLLCPSSGLAGTPERFRLDNEEFIRDPFFLKELHEALLNTFVNLRLVREASEGPASSPTTEGRRPFRTMESPTTQQHPSFGEALVTGSSSSRIFDTEQRDLLRFSNLSDYRRFVFVVQWVLSFDKLMPSPHLGYPPYDPRNGVVLAAVPLYLWRWYHQLERLALYFCGSGDLVKDSNKRTGSRNGHLCIVESVLFFLHSSSGESKPCANARLRLHHIQRVCYSTRSCRQPCVAFLSEADGDLFFMPKRQHIGNAVEHMFSEGVLGLTAVENSSTASTRSTSFDGQWATREVLHIVSIIRDLCFSSIETNPVIPVECIEASTVSEFLEEVKRRAGRPVTVRDGKMVIRDMKELTQIWAEFRERVRELRNLSNGSSVATGATAAVPIYENHTNNIPLTVEQLREMQSAVEQDRRRRRGVRRGDFQGQGGIIGFTLEGIAEQSDPVERRGELARGTGGSLPPQVSHGNSLRSSSVSSRSDSLPSFVDQEAVYSSCAATL